MLQTLNDFLFIFQRVVKRERAEKRGKGMEKPRGEQTATVAKRIVFPLSFHKKNGFNFFVKKKGGSGQGSGKRKSI